MDSVVRVSGVCKSYKKVRALSEINLEVKRGQIYGLIGPDGAGKSTLIHIITGVLTASSGQVEVLGKDVLRDPESIKSSIGFLPQGLGLALAQELSVEENIDFFAKINNVVLSQRQERKKRLLEATQLEPFRSRPAKNLSGGMKQKLALCCTLIHEPELIFLDEPTTGVDPISRRELWTLVNRLLKEKGLTVFLTTSYMDEASRCHEIALMYQGKIIEAGSPQEFPLKLEGKFAESSAWDQQKALGVLRKMPQIKIVYPVGQRLNMVYHDTDLEGISSFCRQNGIQLEKIETGTAGVEDVFLTKLAREKEVDESAFEEFFKGPQGRGGAEAGGCAQDNEMIRADSLEKKFGDFVAVNKVSFSVRQGEIFGFLGPNGAGKTTTIKMLCGLFPPTSGFGRIAGLNLFKQQFEIKQSIGYMSQKFSLYRDLSVAENIELYGGIYGVPPGELSSRRDLILKIADLEGKSDFITDSLPMGIKQRLALGCAIIHRPRCIFLDEPTSGVDPIARKKFWDIIYILSRRMNVTILVTTHYMDEAEHCDRISLMTRGSLVALGNPQELKEEVYKDIGILLELTTSDAFLSVELLKENFPHCLIYGAGVHVYTRKPDEDMALIVKILGDNNITLEECRRRPMPFEDVFVYFCERAREG